MTGRQRVILESPLKGDGSFGAMSENIRFARRVCRHLISEGYNPYASHLFFTQFLDDRNPEERQIGIDCGIDWSDTVSLVVFALRTSLRGQEEMSEGMKYALNRHKMTGKTCLLRYYDPDDMSLISEEELT